MFVWIVISRNIFSFVKIDVNFSWLCSRMYFFKLGQGYDDPGGSPYKEKGWLPNHCKRLPNWTQIGDKKNGFQEKFFLDFTLKNEKKKNEMKILLYLPPFYKKKLKKFSKIFYFFVVCFELQVVHLRHHVVGLIWVPSGSPKAPCGSLYALAGANYLCPSLM